MKKLFDDFLVAAQHAKSISTSKKKVVTLYPRDDQWAVELSDANPSEFAEPLQDAEGNVENETIAVFFEYAAANDDHCVAQAI